MGIKVELAGTNEGLRRSHWLWPIASIVFIAILLTACNPTGNPSTAASAAESIRPKDGGAAAQSKVELTVFAAASLTEPFTEIGRLFQQANPSVKVTFSFDGSQRLRAQLEQGARADVFASANNREMNKALSAGLVSEPRVFARNWLAVILPASNPANIAGLQDLSRPGLKLAIAQRLVPAGEYTLAFLDKISADPSFGTEFKDRVMANVVTEEDNVKKVITKATLGEVDAGVVYSSDISTKVQKDLETIAIPSQFNVLTDYPIAVVQESRIQQVAKSFVSFVLSSEGQIVLARYGFAVEGTSLK